MEMREEAKGKEAQADDSSRISVTFSDCDKATGNGKPDPVLELEQFTFLFGWQFLVLGTGLFYQLWFVNPIRNSAQQTALRQPCWNCTVSNGTIRNYKYSAVTYQSNVRY